MQGSNVTGADICFQVTAPCGNAPTAGSPVAAYVAGSSNAISVMKNMDHYAGAGLAGNITVNLWGSTPSPLFLGAIADSYVTAPINMYTVQVTIPQNTVPGSYVLQVVYATDNSDAPAAFYTCSDITVVSF